MTSLTCRQKHRLPVGLGGIVVPDEVHEYVDAYVAHLDHLRKHEPLGGGVLNEGRRDRWRRRGMGDAHLLLVSKGRFHLEDPLSTHSTGAKGLEIR